MQKIKFFFIGFGFLWIFIWSVIGSIIGVQLAATHQPETLFNASKEILVSAHAHMNVMGMTMILYALILNYMFLKMSKQWFMAISACMLFGPIFFGLGLLGEAFNFYFLFFKCISSFGAILFLIAILCISGFFLSECNLKKLK